jgi:hypothetical protein
VNLVAAPAQAWGQEWRVRVYVVLVQVVVSVESATSKGRGRKEAEGGKMCRRCRAVFRRSPVSEGVRSMGQIRSTR